MQSIKKYLPYASVLGIFILFKYWYRTATTDELGFLLRPTDFLVGLVSSSNSKYLTDAGYFHENLQIIIDKSCSGFNFWMICFVMLSFLLLSHAHKRYLKYLALSAVLILSYACTILVNTSRILCSIFLNTHQSSVFGRELAWLHQAEGTFVYFSALVGIYLASTYFLNIKTQNNAKLA